MATGILQELRDILRRDAGIESSLRQVEQLSWMIFLKVIDDRDRYLELFGSTDNSPIPPHLSWQAWTGDLAGMTADELLAFVNQELLPTLRQLPVTEQSAPIAQVLRNIFESTNNYMKSGMLMQLLIERIDELDFAHPAELQKVGDEYEHILDELSMDTHLGQFSTPTALSRFVVNMIDPQPGETVFDPACGMGNFLVHTMEHLRVRYGMGANQRGIYGCEMAPLPYLLCVTNLILHDVHAPWQIQRENALARPFDSYGPEEQVDIVITTPPWGKVDTSIIESQLPAAYRTSNQTNLFLLLSMAILKPGGRAAIVTPDGTLFSGGVTERVKEKLLEECNLHTVVRLPPGTFSPYTTIKTNLLFFTKGQPTRNVWYYERSYPAVPRGRSKIKLLRLEDFTVEAKWWTDRKENERAWRVSIEEIKARGYNLDIPNPREFYPLDTLRLSELRLRRFRGFEKLDLRIPAEGPTVFIGVNGAGKSSLLDAAAALLGSLVSRVISTDHRRMESLITERDLQIGAKTASVGASVVTDGTDQYWEIETFLSRKSAESSSTIARHAKELLNGLQANDTANVPVLCYYPATRGLGDETDGKRPTYPFRQLYAYDRAFRHEAGHFQDFIRWFRLEEDLENQIRLRDNSEHRSPLLNVVRRAIERFLSVLGAASFSFLRIERPKEVMPGATSFEGSLLVDKDGKPLRIDQLSEGERNTILLVADLARRFALANPGREDPLEGSGIVLIDEIDLHLHPAWQRSFLPALMATFPRCQFLVSTHSPQALSRIPKENVFVLENFELQVTPFTYGRDSNSILDEVMGVPERPEDVSAKIREVAAHIDRDRIKEARAGLNALADLLGEQDSEVVRLKTLLAFLND